MELREAVLLGVLKAGMRDVKNVDVDFNLLKHVKRFFSLKTTYNISSGSNYLTLKNFFYVQDP